MKPILVLQHLPDDGPGYLQTWLREEGLVMDLRSGAADYPVDLSAHAALAVLGGAMSANDDLPAMRRGEGLILDAFARDVPVIGHCLGGQLMARALGERVSASPLPEVGWHRVDWEPEATQWFGAEVRGDDAPEVFQWHFEAFSLPHEAVRLGGNAACANQAFALGPHLAMQFHVELDAAKLDIWTEDHVAPDASGPGPQQIQSTEAMYRDVRRRIAAQQRLAGCAYKRWVGAAVR